MPNKQKGLSDCALRPFKHFDPGGSTGSKFIDVAAREQGGIRVWLNDRLIGLVVSRRTGFDAFDANRVAIGRFNTVTAAAHALLKQIRVGQ